MHVVPKMLKFAVIMRHRVKHLLRVCLIYLVSSMWHQPVHAVGPRLISLHSFMLSFHAVCLAFLIDCLTLHMLEHTAHSTTAIFRWYSCMQVSGECINYMPA